MSNLPPELIETLTEILEDGTGVDRVKFHNDITKVACGIIDHLDKYNSDPSITTIVLKAGIARALATYVAITTEDTPEAIKHTMGCIGTEISIALEKKREMFNV